MLSLRTRTLVGDQFYWQIENGKCVKNGIKKYFQYEKITENVDTAVLFRNFSNGIVLGEIT